jgi:hypothetical protein
VRAVIDARHAFPNRVEFNFEDSIQILAIQRSKHNHFVDAINELRREFTSGSLDSRATISALQGSSNVGLSQRF